jgi:hypothetical protein
MKRFSVLMLGFLPWCHGLMLATEVGGGIDGRTAGCATRQSHKRGTDVSVAVHKAGEIVLEDQRVAGPLTAGADIVRPRGRKTLEDLANALLNRPRHPV